MLKLMVPAMLLAVCLPQAALAQQAPHADIHVAYRDLDLRTPAGIRLLDRRIEGAIAEICPSTAPGDTLDRQLLTQRCRTAKRAEVASGRAAAVASAGRENIELAARAAP